MSLQNDKSRKWALPGGLLIACVALVGLHYGARRRGRVSLPEEAVLTVLTPLQGALTRFGFAVRERAESVGRVRQLEQENDELREQVKALKTRIRELEWYFGENKRLRELLALDPELRRRAVFAEVISLTTSNWFQRVRINRGRAESVQPKDVVMTGAGLAGQVIDAGRHTATVQLLIDRESGVAARVSRSRATGVVRGSSGPRCELEYLDRDADVIVGDRVLTSGRGDVYPSGLIIGEVVAVHKDRHGTRHSATVKLATDFSRLEEVFVLKERERAD